MTETLAFLERPRRAHPDRRRRGRADRHHRLGRGRVHPLRLPRRRPEPAHPRRVSNKVQGVDGVWRALDARGLHAMTVTASEHYNTELTARIRAYTGADVTPKVTRAGREPVWEIAGIPASLIEHFSTRRAAIAPLIEELTDTYRREHGRAPDAAARQAIGRQATLATRAPKKDPKSLPQLRAQWTARARAGFGRDVIDRIAAVAPGPKGRQLALDLEPERVGPLTGTVSAARRGARSWRRQDVPGGPVAVPVRQSELVPGSPAYREFVDAVAARAVARVAEGRSTWSVWNVHAATQRLLRDPGVFEGSGVGEPAPDALKDLVRAVTEAGVGAAQSVRLTPDPAIGEPQALRRADGTSVFTVHASARFTSRAVLDAEERLLSAATQVPSVPQLLPDTARVKDALDGFATTAGGRDLDPGQRALVEAFALDPRTVVAGIGPAGTGKTTAMSALHHALTQTGGGRLIPLATSAKSAAVLAEDLGIPAENIHAFLTAHGLLLPPSTPSQAERHGAATPAHLAQTGVPPNLRLHPGDVILVDEAGMAGTFNLDRLLALAEVHGARLRLLGDDRQLAAVESGGALRLIASEAGAVHLDTVHRFAHAGEAAAAARIRVGDAGGLDHYQASGLIQGGEHTEMVEAAYAGWLADMRTGRTSLLITGRNEDVTALSARARADRVTAGQVESEGVSLHDGNAAGAGDWVVVRENDRRIRSTGGRVWARNGETFTVTARNPDGSMTARHQGTGAILTLPASYVARAVELAYAATVHRAQGATVDTAHALITPGDWREALYVAITRARTATRLYVATHMSVLDGEAAIDQHQWDPRNRTARTVLETVLARQASEPAATTATAQERQRETLLSTLVPRYQHAHAVLTAPYYRTQIRQHLGENTAEVLGRDPQASAVLLQVLREAHHAGWDPADALTAAARILPTIPVDALPHALDTSRTDPTDALAAGAEQDPRPVLAHRLARAVEDLTGGHPAPTPQAEPTPADRARYARLLTDRDLIGPDAAIAARATSPASTPQASDERPVVRPGVPEILRRPEHRQAPDYHSEVRRVFDRDLARALPASPAWEQVRTGLFRAELLGHDPLAVLRTAAERAGDLTDHTAPATVLAEQVRAVATGEDPTMTVVGRHRGQDSTRAAFDVLARILKAHEQATSTDSAELLPSVEQVAARAERAAQAGIWAGHRERSGRLYDTLNWTTRRVAREHRQAVGGPLPWTPGVLPGTTTTEHATYLDALGRAIAQRVGQLHEHALTAVTAQATGRPVDPATPDAARNLTENLGHPGYGSARTRWAQAAAIVAAHREQHGIADQPGTGRTVLGPFPTTDAPAAYTDTYWAAAHAAVAARHHARPNPDPERDEPRADGHRPVTSTRPAPEPGEVARARYHQLSRAERDQVAAVILGRLGALPSPGPEAGGPETVEERARAVDEAVTHPVNTAHLRRVLAELHPDEHPAPRTGQDQQQQTRREHESGPRRDPTRLVPDGHRVELPARRPRDPRTEARPTQPGPRPQTQPAPQPAPEPVPEPGPRWDGTPQPGRPYIDPYSQQPRLRW